MHLALPFGSLFCLDLEKSHIDQQADCLLVCCAEGGGAGGMPGGMPGGMGGGMPDMGGASAGAGGAGGPTVEEVD